MIIESFERIQTKKKSAKGKKEKERFESESKSGGSSF